MEPIRKKILSFIFSKGFVRRRDLWYFFYLCPFAWYIYEYDIPRI